MDDMFPYNAGIMLMNIPYLRKTNEAFVNWILQQKNGLYFDGKQAALTASSHDHDDYTVPSAGKLKTSPTEGVFTIAVLA